MKDKLLQIWTCSSSIGFIGSLIAFILYWFDKIDFHIAFFIWIGTIVIGGIIGIFGGTDLLKTVDTTNNEPPIHSYDTLEIEDIRARKDQI